MHLKLSTCTLRGWRESDAAEAAKHANNPRVKRFLRDRFPHPYTEQHALDFIAKMLDGKEAEVGLCITWNDKCIGSISFRPQGDMSRYSAEIGYWLSEEYWGRGIATEAVQATSTLAMEAYGMHRLFGLVDEGNLASQRVLLKAGYTAEARLRHHIYKNGHFVDQLVFAYIAE